VLKGGACRRGWHTGSPCGRIGRALPSTLLLAAFAVQPANARDLFEMTLEELGTLQITTVTRRSQPVRTTASAVYVITGEAIRRSGFTQLPEILRLAPGVEVARSGSHSWTISIRGFNDDLSNKLLVLIDGRSVYSPLFGGVFWDAQDTLIQDIERIEVVAGPGGTLWGSNAVNGVINIITRDAGETQGGLVEVGAGNERRGFASVRYGWQRGTSVAARAYLKYSDNDSSELPDGQDALDSWQSVQAGFRLDRDRSPQERLTVQGDVYDAELGSLLRGDFTLGTLPGPDQPRDVDIGGLNLLARWDRDLDNGSHVQLQTYFDHTSRDIPGTYDEERDTLDVDFQHDLARAGRHRIIWGAGFRVSRDDLSNTLFATFVPDERTDQTYSLFMQDDVNFLDDTLTLTLGTKLEHNSYTGYEVQPNIRIAWQIDDRQTLWAATSRAVRIPSRLDADVELTAPFSVPALPVPLYANVSGNDEFEAEELVATKVGYRIAAADDLSFDVSVFHHDYDRLQTQEVADPILVGDPLQYVLLPITLDNNMKGDATGGTVVANWQPVGRLRLEFQYSYLDLDLELRPGSTDGSSTAIAGNSPEHQAALHSWLELPHDVDVYAGVRYVDELPSLGVRDRTALDLSVGWQPVESLRLSLTVRNLNDDTHLQFGGGNLIERSAWLSALWNY
jgi:iron complex outermembrane recepter protein